MKKITAFFDCIDGRIDSIGRKLEGKKVKFNPTIFGSVLFIIVSVVLMIMMPKQIKLVGSSSVVDGRTFPKIVLGMMFFLSLFILVKEIVKIILKKDTETEELNLLVEVRALIILALILLYFILLKPIGFLISSILFGIGMTAYFRVRKWYYYAIVIAAAIAITYVFETVLHVRLP